MASPATAANTIAFLRPPDPGRSRRLPGAQDHLGLADTTKAHAAPYGCTFLHCHHTQSTSGPKLVPAEVCTSGLCLYTKEYMFAVLALTYMTDANKILQAIEEIKSGQRAIKEDLKSLKEGQRTQELKAE